MADDHRDEIERPLRSLVDDDVFVYDAHQNHTQYAFDDIRDAFRRWRLVQTMVRTEFNTRYKGTVLGAFWLTATATLTVLGLGVIYAQVFQTDFQTYLPYVGIGLITWGFISGFVNESVSVYVSSVSVFSQIRMPLSIFPMRLTGRLTLTFFYRSLVIVGIMIFVAAARPPLQYVLALAGLAIVIWTGFWISILFGVIGARYRDFGQFIGAFMTFAFFLTPVFWDSERLGPYAYVAQFNPFFHFLNIVRGPLLGLPDIGVSFAVALVIALIAPLAAFGVFARFRHRLAYWC
ncbi:MAG: ABC transporter permease [Pseudomonadota bacterium]